ncbi:MAG TPA: hypothetical protein VJP79_05555 [Nitrososphaera sp.]|nr:hypothetical protein [Nitrososphaera sp.]
MSSKGKSLAARIPTWILKERRCEAARHENPGEKRRVDRKSQEIGKEIVRRYTSRLENQKVDDNAKA